MAGDKNIRGNLGVKRKQARADFSTQIGRITAAAVAIYGERDWLAPIARGVGNSRSTLYRYIKGKVGMRNVDRESWS